MITFRASILSKKLNFDAKFSKNTPNQILQIHHHLKRWIRLNLYFQL
jgi:hypothetical protein